MKKIAKFATAACLFAILLGGHPAQGADSKEKSKVDDLDAQLLEGLGLEDDLPQPAQVPSKASGGVEAGGSADENPLVRINRDMRQAQDLIVDPAASARPVQEKVVADLDELIKQMEKQCQGQCQGKGTKRSSVAGAGGRSPIEDSTTKLQNREVKYGDLSKREALLKAVWGQLPKRQQQQMLDAANEKFLPKYEQMIEEYFRNLAERAEAGE